MPYLVTLGLFLVSLLSFGIGYGVGLMSGRADRGAK